MNSDLTLLLFLERKRIKNHIAALQKEPILKIVVVSTFSVTFWSTLFWILYRGYYFLAHHVPIDIFNFIFEYLFAMFYFALLVMITFSSTIIAFSVFFHANETKYLMTCPIQVENIFAYKLLETFLFASWAVFFIGLPVCFSYGIHQHVSLYFYPLVLLTFIPYVTIPATIGSLVAIAMVRYLLQRARLIGWMVALLILGGIGYLGYSLSMIKKEASLFSTQWIFKVLDYLDFARHPLLPSTWMTKAMLSLEHQDFSQFIFYALLLISTALFLYSLAYIFANRHYLKAWSEIHSYDRRHKRWQLSWIPKLTNVFFFLKKQNRLFLEKDIKIFLRDPLQWSQFGVLLGLLLIYILNLRNLRYDQNTLFWKHIVGTLNLTATALTMCTFASRFIFPMISLEGKRLWTLGIMPIQKGGILIAKFVFAVVLLLICGESLVLLSCYMLRLSLPLTLLHGITMLGITFGVAGLSVGLGAIYPNFKEDSPAKIVSGFGGTLNLVLNLIFVLVMVSLQFMPSQAILIQLDSYSLFYFTGLIAFLITFIACILPLYLGIRHFQYIEI